MIIDSHCHLDYPPLSDDLAAVMERARAAEVVAMVAISTKVANFAHLRQLIDPWARVGCSVGTHPHNAGSEMVTADELLAQCDDPRVVAIGECGLDYHYKRAPITAQETSFVRHIAAARESGLPVVIHSRDADEHMETILRREFKNAPFAAVLHCFSGGHSLARCAMDLGFFVSASGIITFKSAQQLRSVFATVPRELLLVETDAPYLAPVPFRGKSNEPAFARHTCATLAQVHQCEPEEMAKTTHDNTLRLFSRLAPLLAA